MSWQVEQVTAEELEVAIQNRDRPLVIDFFATWCGPCLLLAKELEQVSSLTPAYFTHNSACTEALQASTKCHALTLALSLCRCMMSLETRFGC